MSAQPQASADDVKTWKHLRFAIGMMIAGMFVLIVAANLIA